MTIPLRQLVDLKAGYPFRGAVPTVDNGNAHVVQMRDVAFDTRVAWPGLTRTSITGRKGPDWLAAGDILFIARGAQNFAVHLDSVPCEAVCSQYFFQLRVRRPELLLAEFLAWQINSLPVQRYLSANAQGSAQLGIARAVLEATPIAVPAIATQHRIVALATAARREKLLLHTLVENRARQLDALALQFHATSGLAE
ncbi:MAG: hypothetical protein CVU34_03935 [Betaproteobacteria bacterium HGW-Betaproteobacteria-7]|jgi:hypothetical protein|nr:MAG: hypothetical protein CVU34_03935 [Betaproteobacteria bacterium HGW-Betaproteobacteria-7]